MHLTGAWAKVFHEIPIAFILPKNQHCAQFFPLS